MRILSYSCPAASWAKRGFVSSDRGWDRQRDASQVLTEAFLPPQIELGDLMRTDNGTVLQTATHSIVATNVAAHVFFIVPIFASCYFKSMAQCTRARPKVPSEGT